MVFTMNKIGLKVSPTSKDEVLVENHGTHVMPILFVVIDNGTIGFLGTLKQLLITKGT
jgi:hypothetical protein